MNEKEEAIKQYESRKNDRIESLKSRVKLAKKKIASTKKDISSTKKKIDKIKRSINSLENKYESTKSTKNFGYYCALANKILLSFIEYFVNTIKSL